ncbi:MAG: phosphoribosyltransferase family protein [Dermatophilaceae bacterium]
MVLTGAWGDVAALVETVLPRRCAACGGPGGPLCPPCSVAVLATRHPGGARLVRPDPCPVGLPPTVATARLEAPLRGLLTAYKDADRRDLAPVLAGLLAEAMRVSGEVDLIVPVPASRRSRRRRGDRPLELLCLLAARTLPGRVRILRALQPRRATRDQSGLDRRARADNVRDSMQLHPGARCPAGARVLLVDDIVTTGATLVEGSRALAEGGLVVRAAVIAATTRTRLSGAGMPTSVGSWKPP